MMQNTKDCMPEGVLSGIRVVDFSQVLSAPFCGMLLADLGAEITKVERIGVGDISREYGPYVNGISLYFCQYNRGKRGIAVNMRTEEGRKIVLDLVRNADVVIENFKAGTLERLGLGYEAMRQVNPRLIYGSISGFGTNGPLSHLPCMDIIAAARSGLIDRSGEPGSAPIKPGFSMCDTWAGLQLLRGLTMALLHRQKSGEGTQIDIAMLDCAFYMCEAPILEYALSGTFSPKSGNHDPLFAPCGEFTAQDGHIVLDVRTQEQWHALCTALKIPEMANAPQFSCNALRLENRALLTIELEKITRSQSRYTLEDKLSKVYVPVAAVQTLAEFLRHPRTHEMGIVNTFSQPYIGAYKAIATPIHFSRTPATPPHMVAAEQPGAHSREVLTKAGYDLERIDALIAAKVVS